MFTLPRRPPAPFICALFFAGCSTGSHSVAPVAPPTTAFAAATNAVCVTPSTQSQVVTLPATDGVSGSISFKGFATGSKGCDELIVSTGADAAAAASSALQGNLRREVVADTPQPILTVSVGAAFGTVPIFGFSQIVTGLTVMGSPSNLPDGTYYATITTTDSVVGTLTSQPFPIIAKNGVLTVGQLGTNTYLNTVYSSSTFTLYGLGVIPPNNHATPTPVPTISPTATPVVTPSPQPTSSVTPTPNPSITPVSSPTPVNADFTFTEGPFVPACYPATCDMATITRVSVTTSTYQWVVDVTGTYVYEGSQPQNYDQSAVYSDQLLSFDTSNNNPLYVAPEGGTTSLIEAIVSSCDSTDDAQCGNSTGGYTEVYLYFDNEADEVTFNNELAAYRANTGSYNFLAYPPKLKVTSTRGNAMFRR